VKRVRAAFRHHGHDAAGIVPIFGVEVVGQNAKFRDGVEIRNDAGAAVHFFLGIRSVDEETVGVFTLPANGLISWIQAAGRSNRNGCSGHDDRIGRLRRHGHDARLKRQEVGKTSAVETNRSHHRPGDDIAHLRAFSFHMDTGVGDGNLIGLLAKLHGYIQLKLGSHVDGQSGMLIRLKSGTKRFDFVAAHGQRSEGVEAVRI